MGPKDCTSKILSYYDVILRESDLDILRGPHWLNDVIIHFYYEWLSRTKLNQHPHAILLVPGAPTYMMTTIGMGLMDDSTIQRLFSCFSCWTFFIETKAALMANIASINTVYRVRSRIHHP